MFCFLYYSRHAVRFSAQFYDRLNQLIEKGIQTFSKECKPQNSVSSIFLKQLMPKSISSINSRQLRNEDSNRCKNIRMVLKYAQKLLC